MSVDTVKLQRLLRTDLPLREIADQLGVKHGSLRAFIRRNRLCDMSARNKFIALQRSVNREGPRA